MPKPRFYNLKKEKQDRILQISRREFAKKGYQNSSYNHIMEQLQISKGAMYYYFSDKADLYKTVMLEFKDELSTIFTQHPIRADSSEIFWQDAQLQSHCIMEFLENDNDNWLLYTGFLKERHLPIIQKVMPEIFKAFSNPIEKALTEGQKKGIIRSDLPISLLLSIYLGVGESVDIWISENEDFILKGSMKPREFLGKIVDMFKAIMTPNSV